MGAFYLTTVLLLVYLFFDSRERKKDRKRLRHRLLVKESRRRVSLVLIFLHQIKRKMKALEAPRLEIPEIPKIDFSPEISTFKHA